MHNFPSFCTLEVKFCCGPTFIVSWQGANDPRPLVDPTSKEIAVNLKYEDLFAPSLGPENPNQTQQQKAERNMLSGYVEPAHMDAFQFENQRRTFTSYGMQILFLVSVFFYTSLLCAEMSVLFFNIVCYKVFSFTLFHSRICS